LSAAHHRRPCPGTYKGASAAGHGLAAARAAQPTSLTLNPSSTTNGSIGTIRVASSAGYDEFFPIATSNASVAERQRRRHLPPRRHDQRELSDHDGARSTASTPGDHLHEQWRRVSERHADGESFRRCIADLVVVHGRVPTSVTGGTSATGTVRLSSAAPTGGTARQSRQQPAERRDRSILASPSPPALPARRSPSPRSRRTRRPLQLVGGHQQLVPVRGPDRERGIVAATASPPSGGPYTLSVTASGRSG
jgi:hypothetical protein